jgi:hypothetical protein
MQATLFGSWKILYSQKTEFLEQPPNSKLPLAGQEKAPAR